MGNKHDDTISIFPEYLLPEHVLIPGRPLFEALLKPFSIIFEDNPCDHYNQIRNPTRREIMKATAWTIKLPATGIPPFGLMDWCAFSTRKEAQMLVGGAWNKNGETSMQGWKRAYRKGHRAVRVSVSEVK